MIAGGCRTESLAYALGSVCDQDVKERAAETAVVFELLYIMQLECQKQGDRGQDLEVGDQASGGGGGSGVSGGKRRETGGDSERRRRVSREGQRIKNFAGVMRCGRFPAFSS